MMWIPSWLRGRLERLERIQGHLDHFSRRMAQELAEQHLARKWDWKLDKFQYELESPISLVRMQKRIKDLEEHTARLEEQQRMLAGVCGREFVWVLESPGHYELVPKQERETGPLGTTGPLGR